MIKAIKEGFEPMYFDETMPNQQPTISAYLESPGWKLYREDGTQIEPPVIETRKPQRIFFYR